MSLLQKPFYFYNGHIKRMLTVFGHLFSDFAIAKYRSDGSIASMIYPIPIKYSASDLDVAINENKVNERNGKATDGLREVFPRMTFGLTNLTMDVQRFGDKFSRIQDGDVFYDNPFPIVASMELNVITKNQFDMFQMIEQIMPSFRPSVSISIKDYPASGCTYDMDISMASMSFEDNYEDIDDERRVVTTFEFEVRLRLHSKNDQVNQTKLLTQFKDSLKKTCDDYYNKTDIDNMSEKQAAERAYVENMYDKVSEELTKVDNPIIQKIKLQYKSVEGVAVMLDEFGNICSDDSVFDVEYVTDEMETKIIE